MKTVADKLYQIALEDFDILHFDRFGRSAFNRYYYAAYLETRTLLAELDSSWARTSHANVPPLLRAIKKQYADELKKQSGKLISTHDAKIMRADLNLATEELASLLATAYEIRGLADYEPDIKITRNGSILELQKHTIHEASSWPRRTSIHTKTIRKIWNALGKP